MTAPTGPTGTEPLAELIDFAALQREAGLPTDEPWSPLRYLAARVEADRVDRATRKLAQLPWPWAQLATFPPAEHRTLCWELGVEVSVAWVRRRFHKHQGRLPVLFAETLPDILAKLTATRTGPPVPDVFEPLVSAIDAALPTITTSRRGDRLMRALGLSTLATLARDLPAETRRTMAAATPALEQVTRVPVLPADPPTAPIAAWLKQRLRNGGTAG
ncbi:MAG: hypothetical protein AAF743_14060 [Planctomycetota bacterium]